MFNIRQIIQKKKEQFRQIQVQVQSEQDIKKAKELQELRKERIRLEGSRKLEQLRRKELSRIAKAKYPSKMARMAQGLAKVMNKSQAQKTTKKEVTSQPSGLQFGSSGSVGLQFGGGKSPFK